MEQLIERLHPNNLRYLFYLVTPNETIFSTMEEVPNYTDKSAIWFLVLIVLEFLFLDEKKYAFNDTITSINAGMLSLMFKIGGRSISAIFYKYFYDRFHIIDLPHDSTYTWIIAFFSQDLIYYLAHRAIHEAGVFWSFHQMHHSSEYYNISTALRQGAIQDLGTCGFDLLQSIAIPPNIFIVHRHFNVLYQFWIHTELVPYLGPLEYFLNTPSSHRVHHGRNPYCIDRNYAGTLIIWDRLFGTYAKEREGEPIAYGLVTPVSTFDQLYCQLFEFKELGYDKAHMKDDNGKEVFPGVWNKLKATFGPPGYFPGVKTKQFFWWRCNVDSDEGIPVLSHPVEIFNPILSLPLRVYLLVNMVLLITQSLHINEIRSELPWTDFLMCLAGMFSTMQMFGYYFDHRHFAVLFDLLRLGAVAVVGQYRGMMPLVIYGAVASIIVLVLSSSGQITGEKTKKTE